MPALLLSCSAALAANTHEELNQTLATIKTSEAREKEILKQRRQLEKELSALQEDTVSLARDLQSQEKKLSRLEDRIRTLSKEEKQQNSALESHNHSLSKAVQGMIRMGRMPPSAVIAMPGEFSHSLKAAKVLGITSEALAKESAQLRERLATLSALRATIAKERDSMLAAKAELDTRQKKLSDQLAERKKLQKQLMQDQRETQKELSALSRKSKTLKDLITSLETPRAKPTSRQRNKSAPIIGQAQKATSGASKTLRSFAQAKGKILLPAQGTITKSFGAAKGRNDTSKGMTILTRAEATVVAPFDGEVMFTGPFMDYGRLVILRHSDGFHTLLAGMDSINCTPGQFLLEGEPIGAMGKMKETTGLYIEVRKNNKPVNPKDWM